MTPIFLLATSVWLSATPSPTPSDPGAFTGDPDTITPGAIGFALTFLVVLATVFLLLDMTRRVRRVRYRGEIRQQIAAEEAELAEQDKPDGATTPGDSSPR